jgi:hypothetical protein
MRRGRRNDIFDQPWVPIAAVIGVIAVIAIAAFFFFGSGGSSGQPAATVTPTPTSASSSSPSATVKPATTINAATTIKEIPTAAVPSTGVFVRVNYLGSYSGTYGANDEIMTVTDSNDKVFEVVNATGRTVTATFRKTDSSAKPHDLTVEIWKDGKVLKTATDASPKAEVSVAYLV